MVHERVDAGVGVVADQVEGGRGAPSPGLGERVCEVGAVAVVDETLISLTLTPVIAPAGSFRAVLVVELIRSPRTVVLVFSVTVLPMLVIVPLALFMAGNAGLPPGRIKPVIVPREAVASCPKSFCPLNNVTAPVY